MVSRQLWMWGWAAVLLGVAGCGAKPAADTERRDRTLGDKDAAKEHDAGHTDVPSGPGSDGKRDSEVDAGTGRCDLPQPSVTPTSTGEAMTSAVADGASTTSDTSNATGGLNSGFDSEPGSFAEGVCYEEGWCWVTPTPIGERFTAVSGTADGNTLFAVGAQGACVQYDQATKTWTVHRSISRGDLFDVEVVSADAVWVAGAEGLDFYDGQVWQRQLTGWTQSIVRAADGELWAVNREQLYVHLETGWTPVEPSIDRVPILAEGGGVLAVVPSEDDAQIWVLGFQGRSRPYHELEVLQLKEGEWSKLEGSYPESYEPRLERYEGQLFFADTTSWFSVEQQWKAAEPLPEHWLDVGATTVVVRDGALSALSTETDVRTMAVPTMTALWGVQTDALWVAPSGGGLLRVDYVTGLTSEPSVAPQVPWHTTTGIEWSASENDAWRGPELEHFDGTTWQVVEFDGDRPYALRIDGSASNDVWFVSFQSATPWHWDGNQMQQVEAINPGGQLTRVRAFDPENVWFAEMRDGDSLILRFDGDGWSELKRWASEDLQGYIVDIAGASASNAYVALAHHVEHFDGESWQTIFTAPEGEVLTAMAADDERVWILGQDYVYHRDVAGVWQQQWYGFQTMDWLGFTEEAVWMMNGAGILRQLTD
jgi:hypothetical protein